jgi:hypothetical protein
MFAGLFSHCVLRHKSLIRPQSGIDQRPEFNCRVMSEESGGGWVTTPVAFEQLKLHTHVRIKWNDYPLFLFINDGAY